jgi:hypothetical protein
VARGSGAERGGLRGVDAGTPAGPRQRFLELRGDPEEQVLATVRGDELHAYREAVRALPGRHAHRGLPTYVEGAVDGPYSKIASTHEAMERPGRS